MANERRLIDIAPYENMVDASVCQIQVYRSGNGYCDVMNFNTKNIPTLDAVEVCFCKDCKHMEITPDNLRWCNAWERFNGAGDDGYCNYGEKQEVE